MPSTSSKNKNNDRFKRLPADRFIGCAIEMFVGAEKSRKQKEGGWPPLIPESLGRMPLL